MENVKILMNEFSLMVKQYLGEHLQEIIIYGSYARGDYLPDSDIDVMILVDMPENELKKAEDCIYDFAYDLELKYGKSISPVVKKQTFFEYWADTLPFYENVKKEGIRVA